MKPLKILVPIDYSKHSGKALVAALRLARQRQVEITVLNVIQRPSKANALAFNYSFRVDRQAAMQDMENFALQSCKAEKFEFSPSEFPINYKVRYGLASSQIKAETKNRYDFLLISKRGSSDVLDKIFGTVTQALLRGAHCPVFVLPEGLFSWKISRILYAYNEDSIRIRPIKWVIDFAQTFQSQIHFVYVSQEKSLKADMSQKMAKKLLAIPHTPVTYEINSVESGDVIEGLMNYCKKEKVQLLCMVHIQRNFLENFFHRSTVKEMWSSFKDFSFLIIHHKNK